MNFKRSSGNIGKIIYNYLWFIYNRYRLIIAFHIPNENTGFRYTLIDYFFLFYMITMISGFFSFILGDQHITLYFASFLSLCIFMFFAISLCFEVIKKVNE